MYRRPKFLETLLEIRREMALEADYDVDLFVGRVRNGSAPANGSVPSRPKTAVEPDDAAGDVSPVMKRGQKIRKG